MSSPAAFFLQTDRLGFRHWSSEDLSLARCLWGDPAVTRFTGGPFSEKEVQERLEKEIASQQQDAVQYWPVFLRDSGEFVGCCGLRPLNQALIFELGFHLRPAYWGKGLALESARAVVTFARNSLHADVAFAGHHPDNGASERVLTKLGFQFTHEELYAPTGRMHRCYLLRLSDAPG